MSHLKDIAGHIDPRYGTGTTKIWYMRPEYFRERLSRGLLPDPSCLGKTHVLLGTVDASDLEKIYDMMQAERWSPMGAARAFIRQLGLEHTSMSVGDVIERDGDIFMVDLCGFELLDPKPAFLPSAEDIRAAQERPCPYCAIGSCRVHV